MVGKSLPKIALTAPHMYAASSERGCPACDFAFSAASSQRLLLVAVAELDVVPAGAELVELVVVGVVAADFVGSAGFADFAGSVGSVGSAGFADSGGSAGFVADSAVAEPELNAAVVAAVAADEFEPPAVGLLGLVYPDRQVLGTGFAMVLEMRVELGLNSPDLPLAVEHAAVIVAKQFAEP